MISKQSKNWYKWLGRANLLTTLAKLKVISVDVKKSADITFSLSLSLSLSQAMSLEDPDIRPYLEHEQQLQREEEDGENKENCSSNRPLANTLSTFPAKNGHVSIT